MVKSTVDIFAEGAVDGVYPGGQLAVSKECQRLVTASVGILGPGLEGTTNETVYDLASLTKPLATVILLGRAIEAGKVALSDPIRKYVPDVDPAVTIENCLDHSSGLPAHARFDNAIPPEVPLGSWDAWRAVVGMAAATRRGNPPGQFAVYSDIGYILLGAALEVIYRMPLSTVFMLQGTSLFFRDRRGAPALPVSPVHAPIAPTEGCRPGEVHDENARAMGAAAGHAGLFGTAAGVLRVAENLLLAYHGWTQGLLQPETVRRLWSPSKLKGSTWALGWDRPSATGSSTGNNWPANSVGHLGYTGTSLWIEPERALIVVLVTNRVCPTRANNLIRRLRPQLYDAAWSQWGKTARIARTRSAPGGRVVSGPGHQTDRTHSRAQSDTAAAPPIREPSRSRPPR